MGIFNLAKRSLGYVAGGLGLATMFLSGTAQADDDLSALVDDAFRTPAAEKSAPALKPTEKGKYKLGIEIDQEVAVDAQEQVYSTTRLEFFRKKGRREDLFRGDISTSEDSTKGRLGLMIPVPLEDVVGSISLFGTFDENENYAFGINIHATVNNEVVVGGEFEAKTAEEEIDSLIGAYVGYKKGEFEIKIGIARRLGEAYAHGSVFSDLGQIKDAEKLGKFYIGLGFTASSSESSFVPSFGMIPNKRGEGVGFRTFGIFKENFTLIDLSFSFNSKLSKYSIMWLPDIYGKCLCDSSIVDNIMDYFTPPPLLHTYTQTLAFGARTITTPGADIYSFEVAFFPAATLRELSDDKGWKKEKLILEKLFINPGIELVKPKGSGVMANLTLRAGTEILGFQFYLEAKRNSDNEVEYSGFITKAFYF
ncbi:MAG: hypothetical protein KAT43_02115 [Nanoarchaeota archaeon]|nr:hypothetical protein [Nanoarchaeota archaeon]